MFRVLLGGEALIRGMAKSFRAFDQDQMLLLPPWLQKWVPGGPSGSVRRDLTEIFNLTAIKARYTEERG